MAGSTVVDKRTEPLHIRRKFTSNSVIFKKTSSDADVDSLILAGTFSLSGEPNYINGYEDVYLIDEIHDGCIISNKDVETENGKIGNLISGQTIHEGLDAPFLDYNGNIKTFDVGSISLSDDTINEILTRFPGHRLVEIRSWARSSSYGGEQVNCAYNYWGSSSWDTLPAVAFSIYSECSHSWRIEDRTYYNLSGFSCIDRHFSPYNEIVEDEFKDISTNSYKVGQKYGLDTFAGNHFHPRSFAVPFAEEGTDMHKLGDPAAWTSMAVRPRFSVVASYWCEVAQVEYIFARTSNNFWQGYKGFEEVVTS